jgi:hypothetical protein
MCCSFSVIQGAHVEIPTDASNFSPRELEYIMYYPNIIRNFINYLYNPKFNIILYILYYAP